MSRYRGTKGNTAVNPGESPGLPVAAQAKRVLVVDDEPGIRTLLAQLLSGAGYVVDMAKDGADAWAMLQKRPYAAVILDLKMPGNGGEALYQQLKSVNEILARRVIFITGDIVNHAEREFVSATGNPIIEKPFDLNTLQQLLESLFDDES